MKFFVWGRKKHPVALKHSPPSVSRIDSRNNQQQSVAVSDNIGVPSGPRIVVDGEQAYAGSFCSFGGAFKGSTKRMIFQEGEQGSGLVNSGWVDKLNHKLGVIFSHEQDGLLSIGTPALEPMDGVGCSLDQQVRQCITSDSHEFSAAGYECRKSSTGRDVTRMHESSGANVSIVTDSTKLNESSSEMKVALGQIMPPRATSKGSRRNSSARSSGGMSRSPSQVCPFLSDLETPCTEPTKRQTPTNSHATGLACGIFPTRLSRRSRKRREGKTEGNPQDKGVRQRSTNVTTFRRFRKLWQPKCSASDSISPKTLAAHDKEKNLIKLIPFETQQAHFAARKSPARSVKTRKMWPYRDGEGGQVDSGGLRRRLQPQKWLPCSSHGMTKKGPTRASENESNQLQRTHAEHFFGEQQQGQWIKTDSEYLVLEMQ